MVGYNADGPSRDRVMKLISEKERIESEIRDLTAVLETNNVDMSEALVDPEGYPRNDVDVYRIRHARHRIICLQNDHKEIMKMIEKGLAEVHSQFLGNHEATNGATASSSTTNNNISTDEPMEVHDQIDLKPFAVVALVSDGSPADLAGLIEKDEVLQFGSINHSNFTDISQILNIVGHSVGQRVHVKVKRDHNVLSLNITPRPWAQPGLLGCQIRRL